MRIVFTYLLMICFAFSKAGTMDSVITLPEVEKVYKYVTVSTQSPITSYKFIASKGLNEVLRENAGLYLKNYGNGQLSSITIRGTSAAQTDVLWNGIKLNSPSLGQVDFSLFNMGMGDQLEFGGISKSGNVGGFINLKNDTYVDSGFFLVANVGFGSFNTIRTYGKAKYGNGKFSGITRLAYLSSDNDYSYRNSFKAGYPKEKLTNSKVQLLSFMQQFNAIFNEQNTLLFSVWMTDAQRQLPPVISKTNSKEAQSDYSLRSGLTWNGKFRRINTVLSSAFIHDFIHYKNPEIYLDEKSTMEAFRNNFTISLDSIRRFSFSAELGYDFESAKVVSYRTTRNRSIGKFLASVKYEPVKELLVQLSFREHIYSKTFSPFSPSLAVNFTKRFSDGQSITTHAIASRNFRFPTLNDLYWVPGGNPNLKTEKSFDGEVGLQFQRTRKIYLLFKANYFGKYIDNWIQWTSNGTYWEPQNVKRVLINGLELSARLEGPFRFNREFNLALNMNYTYTRAQNLDALSSFDQSKGKQLIYVPVHLANALLHLEFKKYYLRISNTYTDAVFIATDNSQKLKGYYLLDLEIGKDFIFAAKYEMGFAFRINNVTGIEYQNVAQRPMPGRNFEGTIRIKLG